MKHHKEKYKGLTINQIKKATNIKNKFKCVVENNKKSIKKLSKPEKAYRKPQEHDLGLLLNLTYSTSHMIGEYPTPTWFKYDEKADVSVIIPLYNNSIENIVESWDFFNDGSKVELIFVDDNCPNNSGLKVLSSWELRKNEIKKPLGKIFKSSVTQGWGACCNIGAGNSKGKILVFIHPEMKLFPGWLSSIIKHIHKPDIGCVGGLLVNEQEDTVIEAGREWSWEQNKFLEIGSACCNGKKISSAFGLDNAPPEISQSGEREYLSSLLMAVKREDFLERGGFSPNLFYREWSDADFCMSLIEKNKKIIYQPKLRAYGQKIDQKYDKKIKSDEIFFHNKWIVSKRIDNLVKSKRTDDYKISSILIRRQAAHGDVLVAASIAPALKKKYPEAKILFSTDCPEVVKNNPWIDQTTSEYSERHFHLLINLDMVYEYRPKTNFLKAYADHAGVDVSDCELYMHTEEIDVELPKDYVVVHVANNSWVGRGWSNIKFDQLSSLLQKNDKFIVCVGTVNDHKPACCNLDLRGQTSIPQLANLIKNAECFIGTDSFPMMIADIFKVKGVAFFGSILPETRLINKSIVPVFADGIKCLGCHHRKPLPCVATTSCEVGLQECVIGVSVDKMWKTLQETLKK